MLENVFLKQKSQKRKEYEVSKLKMDNIIESLRWKKDDMEKQVEKLKENHQTEVEEWRNTNKSLSFTISTLEENTAKQTAEFDSKTDQLSKKEKDLQVKIKTLEEKMHNLNSTMEEEAILAAAKNSVNNIILERDQIIHLNEDQRIRINELEDHEQETFEDWLTEEMMEMGVDKNVIKFI